MGMKQIGIFRHGSSAYKQPHKVSLEEACDLVDGAEATIKDNAREFSYELDENSPVVIYSSPIGRSLHTAKIIIEEFDRMKLGVEKIICDDNLEEVKNFKWEYVAPLFLGGELNFNGEKININQEESNPRKLSFPIYFMNEEYHSLSSKLKCKLPKEYLETLESFERFSSVKDRMQNFLKKVFEEKTTNFVAVTHEGLVYHIVNAFTDGRRQGLGPGQYIILEGNNAGLYAIRAGSIKYGNCIKNILKL